MWFIYSYAQCDILFLYTVSYFGVYVGRVHFCHSKHDYQNFARTAYISSTCIYTYMYSFTIFFFLIHCVMFWRVCRSSAFWPLRARISKFTYTTYISSTCIYTHKYSLTLSDILIVYTMSYSGVYIGRVHFGHSEHGYQHSHAQRIYRRHVFTNRYIHLHNVIVFFNTMSYSGVYVGRAHFCHSEHGYPHSNTQCIYHRHVLAYTYVRVHNVIFYIYVFIYITTCVFIHHVTFRCVYRSGAFLPLQAHQSKFTLTMLT